MGSSQPMDPTKLPEEPEMVIRQVHDSIWTFSRPFLRGGVVPVGGRGTAIKLSSGSFLVYVSTPLTPSIISTLSNGPTSPPTITHLVVPDAVHWLFLSQWASAFPSASVWGVTDVLKKRDWKSKGVTWTGVFGGADGKAPKTGHGGVAWPEELAKEVEVEYVGGFQNQDVALLHKPSRTLIEADLLFNLPAREQFSKSKDSATSWFLPTSLFRPGTWFTSSYGKAVGKDKLAMADSVRTIAGWDFDRIIPCHGDVIETGGKKAWTDSYAWYLQTKLSAVQKQSE